jgi:hypothetical protein
VRKPDDKILEHQRKREIELKLLEVAEALEEKGCDIVQNSMRSNAFERLDRLKRSFGDVFTQAMKSTSLLVGVLVQVFGRGSEARGGRFASTDATRV